MKRSKREPVIIYRSDNGIVAGYNGCGKRVVYSDLPVVALAIWNKYKDSIPSYDGARWLEA